MEDITGRRFGRLTVIGFNSIRGKGITLWDCICDCSNRKTVRKGSLTTGHTISCGCYQRERASELKITHGHTVGNIFSDTYATWNTMIGRCLHKNNNNYHNYGGRGIKVCDEWKVFDNFLEDMGIRPKGKTLDRIDNNGNYTKENCRWATRKEQMNNTRKSRKLIYKGEELTISELSSKTNLGHSFLYTRIISLGWSVEDAVNAPKNAKLKYFTQRRREAEKRQAEECQRGLF